MVLEPDRYGIWMDEQHMFAYTVPEGTATWDAAVATCEDALPRCVAWLSSPVA
jgi:hypothetical protein